MASSSLTAVAASKAVMVTPKDEQKPFLEQLLREGATEDGSKELLAVIDGYRESTQSWRELLGNKRVGLSAAPKLAIGDGSLGFWIVFKLALEVPGIRT